MKYYRVDIDVDTKGLMLPLFYLVTIFVGLAIIRQVDRRHPADSPIQREVGRALLWCGVMAFLLALGDAPFAPWSR